MYYVQASQDSGLQDEPRPLPLLLCSNAINCTVQEFLDQVCYHHNFNNLIPNSCPGTFFLMKLILNPCLVYIRYKIGLGLVFNWITYLTFCEHSFLVNSLAKFIYGKTYPTHFHFIWYWLRAPLVGFTLNLTFFDKYVLSYVRRISEVFMCI